MREELGDVLMQVVFHARMAEEAGNFDLQEVIDEVVDKLIRRHPHVFGDVVAKTSDVVLANWDKIKTEEKQRNTLVEKLRAIPPMMPALMRASKVGKKAGRAADADQNALLEQLALQIEQMKNTPANSLGEEQIGTLLMTVTDLSRTLGVDAEHALMQCTDRVIDEVAQKSEK